MTTKLVKKEESQLATTAAADEVNEMFGGSRAQIPIDAPLPQIKILRESPQYEMPDGQLIKEFTGHIIHWHNANQYYKEKFGEGSEVPTCASSDGIKPDGGIEPLAEPCRTCPLNEYGSVEEGTGKACQNTIRLYVLLDGEVIPCSLKAPPSSLGKKESLMRWLTSAPNVAAKHGCGVKYQPIKVKFSLHRKNFQSGMSASVIDLETIRVLDPQDQGDMTELKKLAVLHKDFITNYVGRIQTDVATENFDAQPDSDDGLPADDCPV